MTNRSPVPKSAPVRPTDNPNQSGGGDLQVNEQDGGQDVAPEIEGEPQAEVEEANGEAEGYDDHVCPPCEEVEP